jgi:hypothetical protein
MQAFFGTLSAELSDEQAATVYADLRHYLGVAGFLDLIDVACRIWDVLQSIRGRYRLGGARDDAVEARLDAAMAEFHEREARVLDARAAALRGLEKGFFRDGVRLVTAHKRHRSGKVTRPLPIVSAEVTNEAGDKMAIYRAEKCRITRVYDGQLEALEAARNAVVTPLFQELLDED